MESTMLLPAMLILFLILISVAISRWVFRINKIVSTLEKILKELQGADK